MIIDLAPIVNGVIVPLLTPALIAAITWAAARIGKLAHIQLQDSQRALLATAIDNAIAYAEQLLAGKAQVQASDKVATAVNYLLPKAPEALKSLGVTPEHLAQMVTAKLPAP